jgi:chromate transport protein ChrA
MDKLKSAFPYGLGAVLVAIIISMSLHLAGMQESLLNYLSYAAYIGLTIYGLKTWREKENGGFISYGMAMGYSTWIALVFSFFIAIWTFVFFVYIAHDEMVRLQAEKMAQQAILMKTKYHMSDEDVEKSMNFAKKFMSPGFITAMALLGNMFILTIVNLIISAFMKKDNDSFDVPQPNPGAY